MLLLHNAGADHRVFERVVEGLAGSHELFALDLPGFGQSDDPARWTLAGLTDEVEDALEALDLQGVHVVGHCVGGAVAWALALRDTKRLRSLALLSPATAAVAASGSVAPLLRASRGGGRRLGAVTRAVQGLLAVPALRRQAALHQLGASPPAMAVRYVEEQLMSARSLESLAAVGAEFASFGELDSGLARPPLPTLLMWGERNRVLPAAARRMVIPQLRPQRVVLLTGGGHLAHLERPEPVVDELRAFFGRLG